MYKRQFNRKAINGWGGGGGCVDDNLTGMEERSPMQLAPQRIGLVGK